MVLRPSFLPPSMVITWVGQIFSQAMQHTHLISPCSSLSRVSRPRNRGCTLAGTSGYSDTTCRGTLRRLAVRNTRRKCLPVRYMPLAMSLGMSVLRYLFMVVLPQAAKRMAAARASSTKVTGIRYFQATAMI